MLIFFTVNSRNTAGIYAAALLARLSHAAEGDCSLKKNKKTWVLVQARHLHLHVANFTISFGQTG